MKGNEDRRGPVTGHAEVLAKMRQATDSAVATTRDIRLDLAAVLAWLDVTGVTGYYASERERAA